MSAADVAFDAYRSEVSAIEDEQLCRFNESGGNRVIGTSFWQRDLSRLRAIQAKHGIDPKDPRVCSIRAYLDERQRIHERFSGNDLNSTLDGTFHLDCLNAKHFPGLNELYRITVDSVPKCWQFVQSLRFVRDIGRTVHGWHKPVSERPKVTDRDVQEVYSILHQLRLPFAPVPPYPSFTPDEANDELNRIANQLEQADERYCAEWLRDKAANACVLGPTPAPKPEHAPEAETPATPATTVRPPAPAADPCTHGLLLLADAQRKSEKLTVLDLAKAIGVKRPALYAKKEFARLRDMGNKLFGMFDQKAKSNSDWQGPRGRKGADGIIEAKADEEPIEDRAVD